jgi:hypothetical protein
MCMALLSLYTGEWVCTTDQMAGHAGFSVEFLMLNSAGGPCQRAVAAYIGGVGPRCGTAPAKICHGDVMVISTAHCGTQSSL